MKRLKYAVGSIGIIVAMLGLLYMGGVADGDLTGKAFYVHLLIGFFMAVGGFILVDKIN